MKYGAAAVLLIASAISSGCISGRSGGASFRDRDWKTGISTRHDVVNAWGNPDIIRDNVWIWCEKRHSGGKVKASYYGIGFTVSRINVATHEHHLEFNDSGRLVRRETHRSIPEGARWSLNPW